MSLRQRSQEVHTKILPKKQNWFRINNVSNVNEVQNLGEREREHQI